MLVLVITGYKDGASLSENSVLRVFESWKFELLDMWWEVEGDLWFLRTTQRLGNSVT